MNIVVIGGTGFIGQALCKHLVAQHTVTCISRSPSPTENNNINYVDSNFDNIFTLGEIYQNADIIIHTASDTTPRSSVGQSSLEVTANLLPTLRLLEYLEHYCTAAIIYLSSGGAVYGEQKNNGIQENNDLNPSSYYGACKASVEMFLRAYSIQSKSTAIMLRPTNVYGPGQRKRRQFGLIPTLFDAALYKKTFHLLGNGLHTKDYLYIDDLIHCFDSIVKSIDSKSIQGCQTFNVANGHTYSVLEIIDAVVKTTGQKIDIQKHPSSIADVNSTTLDCTRLNSFLGWQPGVDIWTGLEKTWQWIKK